MRVRMKHSLLKSYLLIVGVVCAALAFSFLFFYDITEKHYTEEAEETARTVFEQEADFLKEYEDSVENLFLLITSSDSAMDYLASPEFPEYMSLRPRVEPLLGSLMKINTEIASMLFYDNEGRLKGMMGDVFFPEEGSAMEMEQGGFSNRLEEASGQTFFHAQQPIYLRKEEGEGWRKVGYAGLLFETGRLQESVDTIALSSGGYAVLLDREKEPIVWAGEENGYGRILRGGETDDSCLIFRHTLPESSWELVNIIPRSAFMSYPEDVQRITLFTYGIVSAALVLLCFLIYSHVIRPIRRQMDFVVNYTKDTRQRIAVAENNEFGELARRINQMLDDLEALNGRVIAGERKLLRLEYAKKQTEMIAYKSQINPHFMYNTLECIRGMALYRGEKEIARLTGSLSRLFQYNVKGKELVTVKAVIKNLQEYARIIDYRFMGKFQVSITLKNESLLLRYLPKMLVQPLVENAVLHGLEPNLGKGTVSVDFEERSAGGIRIRVEDNGCGMTREKLEELRRQMESYEEEEAFDASRHGIGISNVFRRMKLFYGDGAVMALESSPGGGTRIILELPEELLSFEKTDPLSG